jgi:hypothetical protein
MDATEPVAFSFICKPLGSGRPPLPRKLVRCLEDKQSGDPDNEPQCASSEHIGGVMQAH